MTQRFTRTLILVILAIGVASARGSAQTSKIDVTGKWLFSVQTDAGTGTLKGKDIKFSFKADAQGTALDVTYTGTVEDKDSLKGTVDLGGLATGTFTAKRQP